VVAAIMAANLQVNCLEVSMETQNSGPLRKRKKMEVDPLHAAIPIGEMTPPAPVGQRLKAMKTATKRAGIG
jgi:hypothetical protein